MPDYARPVVLVARDAVHETLMDGVARELSARGFEVHRGMPVDIAAGELAQKVEIVVTTMRGKVSAATMGALPRLHTVVVPTTGIEAVEMEAATSLGIAVANGATVENVVSMAEGTAMLVLALLYRLPKAIAAASALAAPPAIMLRGKTVGLIGWGEVAKLLAPRLRAFETTVLVRSAREGLQAPGVSFVTLDTLLERSDVVCVLGALKASTRHLLGRDQFRCMKKTAFVVNTARGGIIDEAALIEALRAGHIAGAALDTFEVEPLPVDSPLRSLPNVILTPHCVGHTNELASSLMPALLQNIVSAREGSLPPYCKNSEIGARWRRTALSSS